VFAKTKILVSVNHTIIQTNGIFAKADVAFMLCETNTVVVYSRS